MRTRIATFVLALLIPTACAGEATETPEVLLEVETFSEQSVGVHLSDTAVRQILNGEIEPPQYNSNPPTSGPHADRAAACGILRQPVPDVYQIHNLAIGVVVYQYSPALEAAEVERIEELGRGFEDRILVAPRPGMEARVVATAWTKMMQLDAVDEVFLTAFYEEHVGNGPEDGECPIEVDEGA